MKNVKYNFKNKPLYKKLLNLFRFFFKFKVTSTLMQKKSKAVCTVKRFKILKAVFNKDKNYLNFFGFQQLLPKSRVRFFQAQRRYQTKRA